MGRGESFVTAMLIHEQTRYDPVKAHEYYLRTRELQGRRSTSDLKGAKKKEGWAYVKSKVQEERKQTLDAASESNKAAVAQLHEKAMAKREEISNKLKQIMEQVTKEGTSAREQIDNEVKSKIAALPEAPKGLNKQQAAEFAAKRRDEIAKIRGEAVSKREAVSTFTKAKAGGERADITNQREQLASDLKGSLDKAKETYQKARDQIKSKYEAELDKEFNSIRTSVK